MSWQPVYLKADTEADLLAALKSAGLTTQDENGTDVPLTASPSHSLIIRDPLMAPTGKTLTGTMPDGSTYTYPEMAPIPGYHADLLTSDPELVTALGAAVVNPSPAAQYRWAGEADT